MADGRDVPFAALRARLVYHADGMETVTPRGIVYRQTPDGGLPMAIYAPPGLRADERRPAVLLVHGGPIEPELPPATEWGGHRDFGALAAVSGWVGVSFKHRFFNYDALEQAEEDIGAAAAYVRAHAEELGVDPDRLCLWAFSGGGPFLARALREPLTYVRCLVAYYAVMDLRPMASAAERADDAAMARLARYSPAAVLEEPGSGSGAPPTLLARAGRDHPALNAGIDAFTQAALTANITLDVLNHANGQHSFDTRDDTARTREIIAHTLTFIRARFEG
ncbi:MAG TPA: hypothetical protein VF808_20145 [Ktedonobacterales bacterium]